MIKTKDLSKSFGKKIVLDRLNLEFPAGENIALIGSNGAGKTTFIRCLLGEYVYQGDLEFESRDIRANRASVLRDIGFVPQLPPPFMMTVSQLLDYVTKICKADRQKMQDIAARLGLDIGKIGTQRFTSLSGGQKQKVLIAIALGRDYKMLIMDEPAANLDPEARAIFFDLLEHKAENTTMLISSHRLDEVVNLVNRVIELDLGRVVIDDFVSDKTDLSAVLECELVFNTQPDTGFAGNLSKWNLSSADEPEVWRGTIAGADRFKFVSMLARCSSSLKTMKLAEKQ